LESRIIAIGDIHGCFRTLEKLVSKLDLSKSDKLILLGDYIDRGPRIKEVIDYILNLNSEGFDVVALMGNHESMLLESKRNVQAHSMWMFNGGEFTLKSFGVKSALFIEKKYVDFFSELKYFFSFENYLFVHAGFNESQLDVFADKTAMLWARKECYTSNYFAGKTIIHGHSPIGLDLLLSAASSRIQVINVDTGCIYNFGGKRGFLSAVELPSFDVFCQENIDI
jgi:serine/threonine protein phosphatase 1